MPEFIDAYGISIFYDAYPADSPRGVVQLAHGVGEHAGRYSAVINALVADGFTVYADDHRGHGRTGMAQHGGDASKLGQLGVGGMAATVAALWQFTQLIRDENPTLPLTLFGHSWGSFLAQMLLNEHPDAYDAVVLSGTALRMPGSLNGGSLNAPWKSPDATGLEWLSRDPVVAQQFRDDPLTTETPLLKLFGPLEAAKLYGRPRRDLPQDISVLIMVGDEDTVGGALSAHKLAWAYRDRSGLHDVTTFIYPGARHEILNELSQAETRADLLGWLDARFPARD